MSTSTRLCICESLCMWVSIWHGSSTSTPPDRANRTGLPCSNSQARWREHLRGDERCDRYEWCENMHVLTHEQQMLLLVYAFDTLQPTLHHGDYFYIAMEPVYHNNVRALQFLQSCGVDYASDYLVLDDFGNPLTRAASSKSFDALRFLWDTVVVNPKVDIDDVLVEAASYGTVAMIRWLQRRGCNIHGCHGKAVYLAALHNNSRVVRMLLAQGVNVNMFGPRGMYPKPSVLAVAASAGNLDTVMRVVMAGAKPANYANAMIAAARSGHLNVMLAMRALGAQVSNSELLSVATKTGHVHVVEYLLDCGAAAGPLELCEAAGSGSYGVVKRLIAHGVDVNGSVLRQSTSKKLMFPLKAACKNDCYSVVQLLLEAGADPNRYWGVDYGKYTLTQWAIYNGCMDTLFMLLDAGSRFCDEDLVVAAECNDVYAIDVLCEDCGIDPCFNSCVALVAACKYGCIDAAEALLDHGACPCKRMLFTAVDAEANDIIQLLLSRGADPNAWQCAALPLAIAYNNIDAVEMLCDAGADPTICPIPLMPLAANWERSRTMRILLEHGADPTANNSEALLLATEWGHCEQVELLLKHGTHHKHVMYQALQMAVKRNNDRSVRALIAHGADPRLGNSLALRHAARLGYDEIVLSLCVGGADVNADNGFPLYAAAANGCLRVVVTLLQFGASVNKLSREHSVPLAMAAFKGITSVVRCLLLRGADPSVQDNLALRAAVTRGHLDVVKVLLAYGADVTAIRDDELQRAVAAGHNVVIEYLHARLVTPLSPFIGDPNANSVELDKLQVDICWTPNYKE